MVDIHTHILPRLDDGSSCSEESIQLLEMLSNQGITDVFATPHFYPQTDNIYDFKKAFKSSFDNLQNKIKTKNLPKIHIGCELFYYEDMGLSSSLSQFCFSESNYLLLELTDDAITKKLFEDLTLLLQNNIIPIIAHIERYASSKNYRKLLNFIKKKKILTQINASSVLEKDSYKFIKKLIKKDVVTFLASDTHSVAERPPQIADALKILEKDFGKDYIEKLNENSYILLRDITKSE